MYICLEHRRDNYNSDFDISHKTLSFSHVTFFQGCHVTVWSCILKMSTIEGSKSDGRDSFSSSSDSFGENTDVWSERGSELEEEIFEEQSQNVLFAFEPVGCLGETDISSSPINKHK